MARQQQARSVDCQLCQTSASFTPYAPPRRPPRCRRSLPRRGSPLPPPLAPPLRSRPRWSCPRCCCPTWRPSARSARSTPLPPPRSRSCSSRCCCSAAALAAVLPRPRFKRSCRPRCQRFWGSSLLCMRGTRRSPSCAHQWRAPRRRRRCWSLLIAAWRSRVRLWAAPAMPSTVRACVLRERERILVPNTLHTHTQRPPLPTHY